MQPDDSREPQLPDLEALSRETGVPLAVLQTFAAISDPKNDAMFSADYWHDWHALNATFAQAPKGDGLHPQA